MRGISGSSLSESDSLDGRKRWSAESESRNIGEKSPAPALADGLREENGDPIVEAGSSNGSHVATFRVGASRVSSPIIIWNRVGFVGLGRVEMRERIEWESPIYKLLSRERERVPSRPHN